MSALYVDTSALIKRYMTESGSNWIKTLLNPANGNVIIVCDLTAVEVFSTLARRQREKTISRARVQILQSHFLEPVMNFAAEFPLTLDAGASCPFPTPAGRKGDNPVLAPLPAGVGERGGDRGV